MSGGVVTKAYTIGESFRGFEQILGGRDPLDAQLITQRICGVCPIANGLASVLAQDNAFRVVPPLNGWLQRNLAAAGDFIQSHLLHFYTLSAVDFVDVAAIVNYTGADQSMNDLKSWVLAQLASTSYFPAAPFLPRYEVGYLKDLGLNLSILKNYLSALDMRMEASRLGAMFAGKLPHAASLIPGGVTQPVTASQITNARASITKLQTFIDNCYIPDVIAVARAFPQYFKIGAGPGNFLSYGVFHEDNYGTIKLFPSGAIINRGAVQDVDLSKISEDVGFSFFSSPTNLHPSVGVTVPNYNKSGAYSWLKAPRYNGYPMEAGPLARVLVAYQRNSTPGLNALLDSTLASIGATQSDLISVLGRHLARALECKIIADRAAQWIDMLQPLQTPNTRFAIPTTTVRGVGLNEAPRGAIAHWIEVTNKKIARYQIIIPTTWNSSPRDDRNVAGPMEQAIQGTAVADSTQPVEIVRIVRSFDPCLSCSVH